MNRGAKRIMSRALLGVAAAIFVMPVNAWALDLDLRNGAITFGGDSLAGVTTYSQGSSLDVAYTDTVNVTGDYVGSDTAITVNGGGHTIVVSGVTLAPGPTDSDAPAILISGGRQDVTLADVNINAGTDGPGLVIDGGEHTVTMDALTISGDGGAGIAIQGGADVRVNAQSDSYAVMGDAPAMRVTEGSDVTVTGDATLTLRTESAGAALTGDGTGTLTLPDGSGATVTAQAIGTQAPVQAVALVGRVRTSAGAMDGTEQTVTTTTITARRANYGLQVRIEYLGDGRFLVDVEEAPLRVELDGKEVEFTFADGIITVLNMPAGVSSMVVTWASFKVGIGFPQPLY